MNSNSFIITSDDLSGGGGYSNSNAFISESDVGGTATGEDLASDAFKACAGYPCTLSAEAPSITFSVSPNIIALGTLSVGSVVTGDTTIETTTNATNGYYTVCYTDGEFRTTYGTYLSGVSDGTVTAGANEYGAGLTGSDRSFYDDQAISTVAKTVAENAGAVTDSSVIVTLKAAMSSTNTAGNYTQIITFVSTGTF